MSHRNPHIITDPNIADRPYNDMRVEICRLCGRDTGGGSTCRRCLWCLGRLTTPERDAFISRVLELPTKVEVRARFIAGFASMLRRLGASPSAATRGKAIARFYRSPAWLRRLPWRNNTDVVAE